MLIGYRNGQGGIILRIKILDASRTDGGGLAALTHTTTGLVISTIADSESAPTSYSSAGGTIESVATLGTYQAPTSGKCRFRELHPALHRGIYEIQLPNARYAVATAKGLVVSVSGPVDAVECDVLIPLTVMDPYAINGGYDPWSVVLPGSYAANTAGSRMGNLDAAVSSRSTYAGGPVSSVTAPVTVGTNTDKTGYALGSAGLDAINVESGINVRQSLAPILAAACGVVSGSGTGSIQIKGGNSQTTRITASTDPSGNRSSVILTLPT